MKVEQKWQMQKCKFWRKEHKMKKLQMGSRSAGSSNAHATPPGVVPPLDGLLGQGPRDKRGREAQEGVLGGVGVREAPAAVGGGAAGA